MLNKETMEYRVSTQSQLAYTYYTMAIYQNSYGMTDKRKPEFKLTVTTVETEELLDVSVVEGDVTPLVAAARLDKEALEFITQ